MSEPSKPKLSNGLFYLGLVLTVGWLVAVGAWWGTDVEAIRDLEPNEFGDFLGGTFAPVAFLWLVLGFWQQGKELRNSAAALWLQMEELRNSVDQQRDLVAATRDLRTTEQKLHDAKLMEEKRASQPMLTIAAGGGSRVTGSELYGFRFTLTNSGRPCNEVQVIVDDSRRRRIARMESGEQSNFTIEAPLKQTTVHRCTISWIDERNNPGRRAFEITTGGDDRTVELIEG